MFLRAALLISILASANVARADDEACRGGSIFCKVDPVKALVITGGWFGAFLGGPAAVIAGGRNLYALDDDPTWETMGYVSGAFSIGGGAMLVGVGLTGYYNEKTKILMPLGGAAMGAGALAILISLLPAAERGAPELDHLTLMPAMMIDREGAPAPAVALSLGDL